MVLKLLAKTSYIEYEIKILNAQVLNDLLYFMYLTYMGQLKWN